MAKPTVSKTDTNFRGYSFEVYIGEDKIPHLDIVTGFEFEEFDNALLKKALAEYLLMQSPTPGRTPAGPKVVIRPTDSLDMKTIMDVARAVRVSDSADITIELTFGESISIPVDPKFLKPKAIKPDPLYLLAVLDEKKRITLNNEEYGNLADTSRLKARLSEIFTARENSGAFRSGSDEIEKTVHVKVPETAKFTDLIEFAKALRSAERLVLQVDPDEVLPDAPRLKIIK